MIDCVVLAVMLKVTKVNGSYLVGLGSDFSSSISIFLLRIASKG